MLCKDFTVFSQIQRRWDGSCALDKGPMTYVKYCKHMLYYVYND